VQRPDLLIEGETTRPTGVLPLPHARRQRRDGRDRQGVHQRVASRSRRGHSRQQHAHLTQAGVVTRDDLLDDIAEVLDDVEAVSDLQRLGRAPPCPLRICARPITADDVHARMLPQPLREGVGRAIGEEIDGAVAFEYDSETFAQEPRYTVFISLPYAGVAGATIKQP